MPGGVSMGARAAGRRGAAVVAACAALAAAGCAAFTSTDRDPDPSPPAASAGGSAAGGRPVPDAAAAGSVAPTACEGLFCDGFERGASEPLLGGWTSLDLDGGAAFSLGGPTEPHRSGRAALRVRVGSGEIVRQLLSRTVPKPAREAVFDVHYFAPSLVRPTNVVVVRLLDAQGRLVDTVGLTVTTPALNAFTLAPSYRTYGALGGRLGRWVAVRMTLRRSGETLAATVTVDGERAASDVALAPAWSQVDALQLECGVDYAGRSGPATYDVLFDDVRVAVDP